ncbi:4-coumarate--CoA ligase 1 [Ixodes scapularis]|uniref:4-coumarate--CoA ligase 1 n=1 Tax=Ixodes scapularis TaxID=6945 RepID=UPI001AD60744|nr:4-coumarate--CoA ligase 1 [Ixodes scapularis]
MLVDDSRALTRAECLTQMQRYAAGFQAHGIQPGDHVCLHLDNSIDNCVAMYGCIFAGAVVVLAKASLTERELYYQVKDADVVHILTDQKFVQKVSNVHAVAPFKGLFVIGDAEGFVSASTFSHWKESEFQEILVPDPERTLMALAYTSGTTGLPKAVEITHFNYVASFNTFGPLSTATEEDVTLLWNPITHSSGLLSIFTPLIGATCVVAPHTLSMEGYADLIDRFKVTALTCFPTRLQNLVQYARSADRRLNTLLHIAVAGGVLSEQLAGLSLSTFGNLRSLRYIYGMSESNGAICVPPRDVVCYTDVGWPCAMVEIKIVNPSSGEALKAKEIGELCFRSPAASRGYYKRPLATAQFRDRDGWCRSGDLAYYDTDGRIYFVERIKEMIKCLDNQVVPAELEQLLLANHDGIAEVAVVGLPHSVYGEAPAAVVVPKKDIVNGGQAMEKEIKGIIAGTCARHKHLYGGVFFMESLPKTETGKVRKKELVDTLAGSVRG